METAHNNQIPKVQQTLSDFTKGERAVLQVRNDKNVVYTYIFRRCKSGARVVSIQESIAKHYIGTYEPGDREIAVSSIIDYKSTDIRVRVLQWAIRQVADQKALPPGYLLKITQTPIQPHHKGR